MTGDGSPSGGLHISSLISLPAQPHYPIHQRQLAGSDCLPTRSGQDRWRLSAAQTCGLGRAGCSAHCTNHKACTLAEAAAADMAQK